jgi:hypothetical protein
MHYTEIMNLCPDKKYHIYLNEKCIYHSLSEEEFDNIWSILTKLNDLLFKKKENKIQYEEVHIYKEILLDSSY